MGAIAGRERLGAPAPAVCCFRETQIFDVYFIHHLGVFLLDLKVYQAILLLFLLREERADGEVAEQGEHAQEGQ